MLKNDTINAIADETEQLVANVIREHPGGNTISVEKQVMLARFAVRAVAGILCNLNDLAYAARVYVQNNYKDNYKG